MKSIHSNIIGELIQNDQFEDWWESQPVKTPFFDSKNLKVTFMDFIPENDPNFLKEADMALKTFLHKNESDRYELSKLAHQNCMDFLNEIEFDEMDKPLWEISDENDIWKFIFPEDIYVTRRSRRDKDIYINVTCECQWEQEHGLQLVFRQGQQLTRISTQDGHITEADAYDIPDKEDMLLSQFDQGKPGA